eukprot:659075-Amphidinium_carterae.1
MHQWVLHRAIWTCGFAMGYLCSNIEGAIGNDSDNDSDIDDMVMMAHTIPCKGSATFRIYRDDDKNMGMLGKMSVKLPMPTQFDGINQHFRDIPTIRWLAESPPA